MPDTPITSEKPPVLVIVYGPRLLVPTYEEMVKYVEARDDILLIPPPDPENKAFPLYPLIEVTPEKITEEIQANFGEGGKYAGRNFTSMLYAHGSIAQGGLVVDLGLSDDPAVPVDKVFNAFNTYSAAWQGHLNMNCFSGGALNFQDDYPGKTFFSATDDKTYSIQLDVEHFMKAIVGAPTDFAFTPEKLGKLYLDAGNSYLNMHYGPGYDEVNKSFPVMHSPQMAQNVAFATYENLELKTRRLFDSYRQGTEQEKDVFLNILANNSDVISTREALDIQQLLNNYTQKPPPNLLQKEILFQKLIDAAGEKGVLGEIYLVADELFPGNNAFYAKNVTPEVVLKSFLALNDEDRMTVLKNHKNQSLLFQEASEWLPLYKDKPDAVNEILMAIKDNKFAELLQYNEQLECYVTIPDKALQRHLIQTKAFEKTSDAVPLIAHAKQFYPASSPEYLAFSEALFEKVPNEHFRYSKEESLFPLLQFFKNNPEHNPEKMISILVEKSPLYFIEHVNEIVADTPNHTKEQAKQFKQLVENQVDRMVNEYPRIYETYKSQIDQLIGSDRKKMLQMQDRVADARLREEVAQLVHEAQAENGNPDLEVNLMTGSMLRGPVLLSEENQFLETLVNRYNMHNHKLGTDEKTKVTDSIKQIATTLTTAGVEVSSLDQFQTIMQSAEIPKIVIRDTVKHIKAENDKVIGR